MPVSINPSFESSRPDARLPKLEIVSDTICPWCYIAKKRFAAALPILRTEGLSFEVRWRPFQLNPDMPKEGRDRRAYRSAKFGSWEKSLAMDARVAAVGAAEGLEFHFERMRKTPNTVLSHVLIDLAWEIGGAALQDQVVEVLFAGYFTEGRDVGDPQVLADLGSQAGLDRARALAAITDPARASAVLGEESLAREHQVNGVPSIILEGQYLFSGAQPVSVVVETLLQAGGLPDGDAIARR